MNNLVSIVMPSFNSEKYILNSINSVIGQTYKNWELIVVDDCSTDGTFFLLQALAEKNPKIKIFQNKVNSGAGISRNKAIEYASGRFIAFLDSDDLWHPSKLERQISFMNINGYSFTYTAYVKINNQGEETKKIIPPNEICYNELLKSNVIGCLTAIYDVEKLGKIYMPNLRKRQDMALWLKILEVEPKAFCLNEILAYYREGNESLSSNKFKMIFLQLKFYRNYLKLNWCQVLYYFTFYVIRALRKHH